MKTILSLVLALSTLSALAGEIKIYDRPAWETDLATTIRPEFNINPELGRAWVNIVLENYTEGPTMDDVRVKVEGLSYNPSTQEIILDAEGTQVVCATVKFRRIFGTDIKNTGNCSFHQKYYKVKVDNGYELETIQKLKITLEY